jgi:hypothetical protein
MVSVSSQEGQAAESNRSASLYLNVCRYPLRGQEQAEWLDEEENAMTATEKRFDEELIACEICLKEVPITEATNPEATDYVVHYYGLECYERWTTQDAKPGK